MAMQEIQDNVSPAWAPRWPHSAPATVVPSSGTVPPSKSQPMPWWGLAGVAVGLVGLVAGIVSLVLFLGFRSTAMTEIARLGQTLATVRSQAARNASSYQGLAGQANGLGGMISPLLPLGKYTAVCTTDLTGSHGPAAYYFPCTEVRP
jgi:hypothetical protein